MTLLPSGHQVALQATLSVYKLNAFRLVVPSRHRFPSSVSCISTCTSTAEEGYPYNASYLDTNSTAYGASR